MRLYHVTNRSNMVSIQGEGLDPLRAVGKRKAVWAGTASKVAWAIVHVLGKKRNRGCTIDDLVVIEMDVPDGWLTRHSRSVWYCYQSIPASRFNTVVDATTYGPGAESE